jgi:hypothetical protein
MLRIAGPNPILVFGLVWLLAKLFADLVRNP